MREHVQIVVLALVGTAACGRLAFDTAGQAADSGPDADIGHDESW